MSLWFGLLLVGVALGAGNGKALGLAFGGFFCVVAPGLAEWRVDYVLEIPSVLAASGPVVVGPLAAAQRG